MCVRACACVCIFFRDAAEHVRFPRVHAASLRGFQSFVILQLVELISLPPWRRVTLILDFQPALAESFRAVARA